MKLKNILIVVDNIEESIHFYNELFGLNVISRQEGNVIMSEGLVLQDAGIWKESMQIQTIPYNNMTELYFEDNDIEGVVKKLESGRYEVRYATALTELDGGQKLVRFYDPSGNLIEVRTPWNKPRHHIYWIIQRLCRIHITNIPPMNSHTLYNNSMLISIDTNQAIDFF